MPVKMKHLGAGLIALIATTATAMACATVTQVFDAINAQIQIDEESALIIWDSKSHTEHFIRRASFETKTPTMGFLVPTPTTPEVVEVDPSILEMAKDVSGPERERPKYYPDLLSHAFAAMVPAVLFQLGRSVDTVFDIDSFQVLKTQDVGGYHVTVLEADHVEGIRQWCQTNHFNWTAAQESWIRLYTDKHWKITAFQLTNPTPDKDGFVTRLVRLSFTTDRPFYPYSEPAQTNPSADRQLNVAVLSDQFMQGRLEEGLEWPAISRFYGSSTPEPAITDKWQASQWRDMAKLPATFATPNCLSVFRDASTLRPGHTDVIFSEAPNQPPLRRTITDFSLPVETVWGVRDVTGGIVFAVVLAILVYSGFRALHLAQIVQHYPDLAQIPQRPAWLFRLDDISGVVVLLFGLFFSFSFFFLPLPVFIKVSRLLRYHTHTANTSERFLRITAPKAAGGAICGFLTLLTAVAYLVFFIMGVQ